MHERGIRGSVALFAIYENPVFKTRGFSGARVEKI